MEDKFKAIFGMSKKDKLETWIVMSQEELKDELIKYNIPFKE